MRSEYGVYSLTYQGQQRTRIRLSCFFYVNILFLSQGCHGDVLLVDLGISGSVEQRWTRVTFLKLNPTQPQFFAPNPTHGIDYLTQPSSTLCNLNKCSAVAEMGDRLATIDMG